MIIFSSSSLLRLGQYLHLVRGLLFVALSSLAFSFTSLFADLATLAGVPVMVTTGTRGLCKLLPKYPPIYKHLFIFLLWFQLYCLL